MIANSHSACFNGLWGSLGSGHRHCVVHVLCWSGRSWHAVEWPLKVAIIGGLVRAHRAAFPVSCGRHQTADFQPSSSPIILNGAVCQDFFRIRYCFVRWTTILKFASPTTRQNRAVCHFSPGRVEEFRTTRCRGLPSEVLAFIYGVHTYEYKMSDDASQPDAPKGGRPP